MNLRRTLSVALTTCVSLATIAQADPVTVRFAEPDVVVGLGATFTMDIVADIPDPVVGWGLDLSIDDSTIASLVGAPAVGGTWIPGLASDGDGLVGLSNPLTDPFGVSGNSVLLATISFSADAIGETDVFLSVTAGDLTEGFPLAPPLVGQFADVQFEAGHIRVTPAPGAVLLALAGFSTLAGLRCRMNKVSM